MIPSIETIVEGLASGTITKSQAIGWLYEHAENAGFDMRDHFAGQALVGKYVDGTSDHDSQWRAIAIQAYKAADAMLEARKP